MMARSSMDLADAGALQLARDFAGVLVEKRAHIRDRGGLLLQQDLAGDRLDLGVGQRDADREAVEQVGQKLNFGERALARRDDHDVAVQLLRDGFGHFGKQRGALLRVADVLLGLVEDEERAGQPTVLGLQPQRLLRDQQELFGRDVRGLRRKLRLEQLLRFRFARGEVGVAGHHGASDRAADIEIVEFALEGLSGRFDGGFHLVELTLRMKPETEAGLGVLLGKADGAKQDSQDRQPHIVGRAAGQRAGRGDQAARAPSRRVQLAEQGAKVLGNRWNKAPGGGAVRESSCPATGGRASSAGATCRCRRSR